MIEDRRADRSRGVLREWVLFAACAAALAALFAYMLLRDHRQIMARERQRLDSAAAVAGCIVSGKLSAVDATLRNIRRDLGEDWQLRPSAVFLLRERLKTLVSAMTSVRSLSVLDASGTFVASNQDVLVGQNFSGREYFLVPRQDPSRDILYVSAPFQSTLGVWILNLTRVLVGPNGEFLGVVTAALDPVDARVVLNAVSDTDGSWGALVHGRGTLFIWQPEQDGRVGKNLAVPDSFFSRYMAGNATASFFSGEVFATGEPSMLALRTVRLDEGEMSDPLVVGVGCGMDAMLAGWREDVVSHALLYAVMIGIGAGVLALTQHWRRKVEQEADLARSQLRDVRLELESFFSISPDLLAIAGISGVWHKLNPAWRSLMGYAEEELNNEPVLPFFHPEDRETVERVLARLRRGEKIVGQVARFRHKDGRYRSLEWSAAPEGALIFAAAHDITERLEAERNLVRLAYYDRLTGLPNRTLFFDRLAQALHAAQRAQKICGVLFVDLDGFKTINDTHGHEAGDEVLKAVAERFLTVVRTTDTVARMGGDEFVFLLHELRQGEDAAVVAEKVIDAVGAEIVLANGTSCQVGASVGISVFPDNGTDMDTLLLAADEAMYRSKKGGKNQFTYACGGTGSGGDISLCGEYLVGVREIDDQHLEMTVLANRLCRAVCEGRAEADIRRLCQELTAFTEYHFATEHRLMRKYRYPRLREHDQAHGLLLRELSEIQGNIPHEGGQFLCMRLEKWTLEHILAEDKALGEFLQQKMGPEE